MASKKPTAKAEEKIANVVIDIDEKNKEQRNLSVGGQEVHFSAPTANVLELKAKGFVSTIEALVIDSDPMYVVADEELRKIKGAEAALDAMRESVSKPLYQAWEANNAIYRQPKAILETGRRQLTAKMVAYQEHQEELRGAEQKRLDDLAEAERKRLADEAAAREEEAAQAAMSGNEQAAEELFQQAEALETTSQVITAPVVERAAPKVSGTSTSYRYGATVPATNAEKIAAMKYLIDNPQFLNLVTFDQAAANKLATALKDNFALPGFKLDKKANIAQHGITPFGSAF